MIQQIKINNFKALQEETLELKALNILSGTNSSGKSSVIQSLLIFLSQNGGNQLEHYCQWLGPADQLINAYSKANKFSISFNCSDGKTYGIEYERGNSWIKQTAEVPLKFEENLYYLSANRIGQDFYHLTSSAYKFGIYGEYLFNYYSKHKNEDIGNKKILEQMELCGVKPKGTWLKYCVEAWIERILDLKLHVETHEENGAITSSYYRTDEIGFELTPHALGTGVSFLTKILILGLSLKEGDILIIENPEIHLHPKAVSLLMEFFVLLAKSQIQVIVETHSEHLINKICCLVYKNKFEHDDLALYYKGNEKDPFQRVWINQRGKYVDSEGKRNEFPQGFFDVDLNDLLEMM